MKNIIKYAFLLWLIVITSLYISTSLKWLHHPFNKSVYDYVFSLIIAGVMVIIVVLSIILREKAYLIPMFLSLFIVISGLTISFLSKTIIDLLGFLWIVILGLVIGKRFIKLSSKDLSLSSLETIIFSVAVGLGFYSLLILSFSLLGILYKEAVFFTLILLSLILVKDIIRTLQGFAAEIKKLYLTLRTLPGWPLLSPLLCLISLVIMMNFIGAIAPEVQYDSLNYHLTVPRIYL
jgi:hypothetical protein